MREWVIFTYYCILLANTNVISSVTDTRYEVFPSAAKWYVNDIKAFRLPLLNDFFSKVVRFRCENDMDYFRLIQGVEKGWILLIEPGSIK